MRASILIEGSQRISFDVRAEDLANLISYVPREIAADVFIALAKHPSAIVRESLAGCGGLTSEVVSVLSNDIEAKVIRALVVAEGGYKWLTTEMLSSAAEKDTEAAQAIASCLDNYETADLLILADILSRHPDPKVREQVAKSDCVALVGLVADEDLAVRQEAVANLALRQERQEVVARDDDTNETCIAHIDFGRWSEMRVGALPRSAAERIARGEEFDKVIEDATGFHPDSAESLLPFDSAWVLGGNTLENVVAQAKRYSSRTVCKWRGRDLVPDVWVMLLADRAGELDPISGIVSIDDVKSQAGVAVANSITKRLEKFATVTSKLQKIAFPNNDEGSYVWTWFDRWKGAYAGARANWSDPQPPKVRVVYFVMSDVLPRARNLVDKNGDPCHLRIGQYKFNGFLGCIIIGDIVSDVLELGEDSDSGIDRAVIHYSNVPTVLFNR